jgi:hypothetical protein
MGAGALRRFAGAIEAAVFAAHLTASSQHGAETMTGAVQSDGEIIRRQTERGCGLLEWHPIEVNLFEHVLILFRQAGHEPLHTLAEDSFGRRSRLFRKVRLQPLKRPVADITPPIIQIDDGTAQNAVIAVLRCASRQSS